MRDTFRSLLPVVCLLLAVAASAEVGWQAPESNIVEKKLDFPSPVQWRFPGPAVEISLISVAWGPADSPEMIAKRTDNVGGKPEFYPDRTYALALGFLARFPDAISGGLVISSGLVRIKNVDGDTEPPMELTARGFVPVRSDVHFDRSNTTNYWDLFPVSPDQKDFLFEVPSRLRGTPKLSFKITLKGNDFLITNVTPGAETCLNFSKNFAGTIGAGTGITLTLSREGTRVSGTEEYVGIGKTLWLQGTADSLGNLVVEERYPKDVVTGIFKGALSQDCRMISGFFSKPDGSRLQPFEIHEAEASKP
jgi:hypothetical protein